MHSPITTTHAIPQSLPSGLIGEAAIVKCSYCAAILGQAYDLKSKAKLLATHKCAEKKRARRPEASLPYN